MGRGRAWALLGLVLVAALAFGTFGLPVRQRIDPSLAALVHVGSARRNVTADRKGTQVTGQLENKANVAVDVLVRARVRDNLGRVVGSYESEWYRDLPPGSSTMVGVTLGPFQNHEADLEIIELKRTPP